jgi:hypothetical protein
LIVSDKKKQTNLHATAYTTLFQRISPMDTCEFSYISRADSMPKRALGIERSWEELKEEMGRTGPGYPGAIYFKTISFQGPQLFAVVNDKSVFYHNHGEWHRYMTACDIKFGTMESSDLNPDRATSEDAVIPQSIDESDWVFVSQDK